LCDYLRQLYFGLPAEYFELGCTETLMDRWQCWPTEYIDRLLKSRTYGRAFGIKVMKPDVMIQQIMPLKFIRMIRQDLDAQARSWVKASKVNYFTDIGDPQDRPPTDVEITDEELEGAKASLQDRSEVWDLQFSRTDVLTISYEALVQDPKMVLTTVLEYLTDGKRKPVRVPTPLVQKLP
ncbi:unnamed protein product, partial [marine sediment metagenome]